MSNQIVISSGAKVRSLEGVLTGTAGIVNSVPLGGANGVATLDALGKVPLSQLPASVVTYLGTWNAATNTPTLTNGVGDTGDLYICNVAGTVNFGAGPITFAVGDWVIYSGTEWQKSAGASGTVTSVAVTESGDALTITGSPITTSGTINIGFAGTGSQYIKGDGTLATFPTTIDQAKRLITEVYNSTGATLTKGTVVYINGGQGNLPTVTKAQANSDSTSAQTYGVVQSDITNMNNGFVVVFGSITDIDTQAYAVGTQLYLSGTTAGEWTSTKPSAPIHLVYVGIVVRSHPTQGVVEVRIQNGYELEELHDVAISVPVNNQGIFYNSSNDLWENKSIATALGYTPADAALVVPYTGATTNVDLGSRDLLTRRLYLNTNNQGIYARDSAGTNLYQIFALNSSDKVSIDQTGLGTVFGGNVDLGTNFLKARTFYSEGSGGGGSYAIKNGTTPSFEDGYTVLSSNDYRLNIVSTVSAATKAVYFGFSGVTATRTYTLPDISGTLALLEGSQTFTGNKTFSGGATFTLAGGVVGLSGGAGVNKGLAFTKGSTAASLTAGMVVATADLNDNNIVFADSTSSAKLQFQASGTYTYTFPNADGTIALTSNLSSYVPYSGATTDVNLGSYTLSSAGISTNIIYANGSGLTPGTILLKQSTVPFTASGYNGIYANSTTYGFIASSGATYKQAVFSLSGLTDATLRTFTLPDTSGTVALTSNLSAYLPLTGGTLTGALSGTSATFTNGSGAFIAVTATTTDATGSARLRVTSTGGNITDIISYSASHASRANQAWIGGDGSSTITVLQAAGVEFLRGTSTGAATFSSSVTANGGVNVGTNALGTDRMFQVSGTSFTSGTTQFGIVNNPTMATPTTIYGYYGGVTVTSATTAYGMYIVSNAGTITNKYGIYQEGTNDKNYFGGNVGIGTASPSEKLHISGASVNVFLNEATSGNYAINRLKNSSYTVDFGVDALGMYLDGAAGAFRYYNGANERMRITSGGNVLLQPSGTLGINTSDGSDNSYLAISASSDAADNRGARIYLSGNERSVDAGNVVIAAGNSTFGTGAPGTIVFRTGADTERMRISSNGGLTSDCNAGGTNSQVFLNSASSNPYGPWFRFNTDPNNGTNYYWVASAIVSGSEYVRAKLFSNGGLANYQANNTNLSDIRTKKDIIPLESYWDKFKAIEIVKFKYNDQTHDDFNIGVIAQQVEEIAPEFIDVDGWGEAPEDGVPLKSVYTADLHHATIKVLQEAMAKIEELEAKVAILEAK